MQTTSVPSYYTKFGCIGTKCEDTCCSGWVVGIDEQTYKKYQQSDHAVLAPLFRVALVQNAVGSDVSANAFGRLSMKPDRSCHFLQPDKLCAIQKNLGAEMLSTTCKLYPRHLNQFGSQREIALGVSCPEAARLVLLPEEPISFHLVALDTAADDQKFTAYRFPIQSDGDPSQIAILNDFRAVVIAILQCRTISIGARMMVLGFLLDDANGVVTAETFSHASELSPILTSYATFLSSPAELEAQFDQIRPNIARKLEVMTQLISGSLTAGATARFNECLIDAAEGLDGTPLDEAGMGGDTLTRYAQSHAAFYEPFFKDKQHIFENYLVNQVIYRLFPFTRGTYLALYRELLLNLSVVQVLLVGMSATYKGLDEARVIQLFQSFARKSDHNPSHLDTLTKALGGGDTDSFFDFMWLLKDVHV